jgi:hypothetical protein
MSSSFGIEYPLQRDGNSQAQRDLEARKPDYAPVEGRNLLELLHFWAQYAKVVLHHDKNGLQHDWSAFFDNSVPFQLAEIYQFDPEIWWATYQDFRNKTSENENDGLELMMGHLFAAFEQHQTWNRVLELDSSVVSQTVRNLTETNLRFILREFVGIFHALEQQYALTAFQNPDIFFDGSTLGLWQLLPEDAYFSDPALSSKIGNRSTILPHLLPRLDRLAEVLYKSQLAVLAAFPNTNDEIESLISQDGYHDPMIGLMLAFLELLREVQGDFNRLTDRHLNYFYTQVLQLAGKAPMPDAAHLVLELAKHVPDAHRLLVGTAFKDGKDDNKAEIIFNSADELIVNRATVEKICTLFLAQATTPTGLAECPPTLPPTNMEVGKPYILAPAETDFPALGRGRNTDTLGRLGFVLASPVLRLAEGTRIVTLTFTFHTQPITLPTNIQDILKLELTIKDGWLEVPAFDVQINADNALEIKYTLTPDIKPIEAFKDAALNPFGGDEPLMQVTFDLTQPNFNTLYQQLDQNELEGISITANVTNVRNQVFLKNVEGNLNPKKSFQPFGTAATNQFFISHPDFYGKAVENLIFEITLNNESTKSHLENIYKLYSTGSFDRTTARLSSSFVYDNFDTITDLKPDLALFQANDDILIQHIEPAVGPLNFSSENTGIALKIKGDPFLHNAYPIILTRQSAAAKIFPTRLNDAIYFNKAMTTLQKGSAIPAMSSANFQLTYEVHFPEVPPYNPVVETLSLSYDATGAVTSLIQLLPFKDCTETVVIGKTVASTQTTTGLVPYIPMEGHLFIGIKDAPILGNLSLLFQFSEYTGNPDLALPDIEWAILTEGQEWRVLQKDIDYVDDTEGFVQSGIIRFELPEKVSTSHRILPPNLSWIRAQVKDNSEAFDHLLGIHAQAIKTVFAPSPNNDLTRLDKTIEAGKIKKFVQETANIGKIEQPYPAFGGRSAENSDAYFRRVSERLRHKGRAISLWDYEIMILEAFPQIYKVKCLNHTLGLRGMPRDFEFLNGFVTIVVVPDVKQLKKSQRDQPKANPNLLQDIKTFLQGKVSPFVQLDVLNPRYETIDTNFNVRFFPGKDDGYYLELLANEIKDFLSPWRTDNPAEIQFGGEVYRSSIIRFIEQREYVDYITDFILNHDPVLKSVQAQTARSVLAAGTSDIVLINNP